MLKKMTPQEFRKIASFRKVDIISKLYIMMCTDKTLFTNKGICPDYYRIRKGCISKLSPEQLGAIYDLLYSMQNKKIMSLTELIKKAEDERKKAIAKDNKAKVKAMKVEEYPDYSLADIMNW